MDKRVKYTKKVIADTLLELLDEKEISKITISELCIKANINRATFYRYYVDVYDLLATIEKEFVEEIKNTPVSETDTVLTFSEELLTVFSNNKKLVKILFNANNNIYFLEDVLELVYEKCRIKWLIENQDLEDKDIEYASIFLFNGALGLINYWVQNDFDQSIEDLASTIERLGIFGLNKYIYQNKKED